MEYASKLKNVREDYDNYKKLLKNLVEKNNNQAKDKEE